MNEKRGFDLTMKLIMLKCALIFHFQDGWNIFDLIVQTACLADFAIHIYTYGKNPAIHYLHMYLQIITSMRLSGEGSTTLTVMRLLRGFRIIRIFSTLEKV